MQDSTPHFSQTIKDLKEQGFKIIHTMRGVRCTEIHHDKPFCLIWEHMGRATGADQVVSNYLGVVSRYRYVMQGALLDHNHVDFELVFDEDLEARGYPPAIRRIWSADGTTFEGNDCNFSKIGYERKPRKIKWPP